MAAPPAPPAPLADFEAQPSDYDAAADKMLKAADKIHKAAKITEKVAAKKVSGLPAAVRGEPVSGVVVRCEAEVVHSILLTV